MVLYIQLHARYMRLFLLFRQRNHNTGAFTPRQQGENDLWNFSAVQQPFCRLLQQFPVRPPGYQAAQSGVPYGGECDRQPADVIIPDTEIHSSGDGFIHTPVVRLKHIPDMLPASCMRPSSAYLPSAGRMKRGLPPAGLEKNNRG